MPRIRLLAVNPFSEVVLYIFNTLQCRSDAHGLKVAPDGLLLRVGRGEGHIIDLRREYQSFHCNSQSHLSLLRLMVFIPVHIASLFGIVPFCGIITHWHSILGHARGEVQHAQRLATKQHGQSVFLHHIIILIGIHVFV